MEKVSLTFRKDSKSEKTDKSQNSRQNVSFKFSKQVSKRLTGNKLNEDEHGEKYLDRELVSSVEDKEVKGNFNREEKKKPLVIQPVHKNVWRSSVPKSGKEGDQNSLDQLAVKELLKETAIENEKWEKREFSNFTVTIPMVVQNKIPQGFETDQNLDVSIRPEEPKPEDYENIPIEEFGAALLRGLGCNPGDPIGNKNRQVVAPIEAVIRSKGLGLGADVKAKKRNNTSHSKDKEEELQLVEGAFVYILQGFHEGHYGEVQGLDESRVIVKLTRQAKIVTLPHLFVEVVSKKEFKKESKVLNKSAYDEFNKNHTKNGQDSKHSSKHHDIQADDSTKHATGETSSENIHSSETSSGGSLQKSHKKRKRSSERSSSNKHSTSESQNRHHRMWVCPLLRVRFIDKQYKKGKYFNQKMTIEDVLSPESVVCRTEDGKYLEDIYPDMLETVVPRTESNYVMVVEGKYKGELGTILKRDKANCIATVNFLSDREKVTKISYDSICEYVGDVSQFD